MRLPRIFTPRTVVSAHCDLPCGVYDPAQARIEAESVKAIAEKYQANTDPEYRTRAIFIKEQRAELVKHHLWVLWTDYFKPPHFEKYPNLNQLFNEATKLAGASGVKGSMDPAVGDSCSARSRRSPRSSGRPSRRELRPHRTAGTSRGCAGRRGHGVRTGRVRTGARAVPAHRGPAR